MIQTNRKKMRMKSFIIIFCVIIIICSCKQSVFLNNICPETNNYWDVKYLNEYMYNKPEFGFNIKPNGDCFYYVYEEQGKKRVREIKKDMSDVIFLNKWKIKDSVLFLQKGKYKIISCSKSLIVLSNQESSDSLILSIARRD